MIQLNTFVSTILESNERLEELRGIGIREEVLRDSVSAGDTARLNCPAQYPRTMPGTVAWAETVCRLREELIPLGWVPDSYKNFETVISPDGELAICIAASGPGTGQKGGFPRLRNTRGPVTIATVERNFQQLSLDFGVPAEQNEEIRKVETRSRWAASGRLTWFLLMYAHGDVVYCELSLPRAMSKKGQVRSWAKRILLAPVVRDTTFRVSIGDEQDEIVVPVHRKAQ